MQEFKFTYWADESADIIPDINNCGIARIRLYKEILPGDEETNHVLNRMKQELKDRNRYVFVLNCYKYPNSLPVSKLLLPRYIQPKLAKQSQKHNYNTTCNTRVNETFFKGKTKSFLHNSCRCGALTPWLFGLRRPPRILIILEMRFWK